ncbi:unnamed protein product [Hydatigera taeniaeformis]|uniref:Endo/exonuclease/phosphatase domain-containing protein n=1 Tax=Hydatigena taeniaeformis TaxID=6205 RepID=A0A158REU9_HYDTA|nr:unnamed protein product [Hydatigera taeniaeformis]
MAFMLSSLLLLVCVLGLPAPSEQKVKVAAFNIQVFGRRKSEKREVMDVLTKVGVLVVLVCQFTLDYPKTGLKMGALAVHIDPDDVVREMEALYTVTQECQRFSRTTNLVILGDMNADCSYLPKQAREALHLRTDYQYRWLITDGMDTTVAKSDCAYDRLVLMCDVTTDSMPS